MMVLSALLSVCTASSSGQLKERKQAPPPSDATAGLVDEDEDLLPQTEYVFNPIQAKKDLKVGNFYAKKGNHRAAVARYLEATKWNPQYADAHWKVAEMRDKLDQSAEALEAYRTFLKIESDGKRAGQARQRIAQLEKEFEQLPLAAGDSETQP